MSNWQIELIGEKSDIEFLKRSLSDSQYDVLDDGERVFLTLTNVAIDAKAETVKAAADQLIDIVNGAARLIFPRYKSVSFVKVSRIGDDGQRIGYGFLTGQARSFSLTAINPNDNRLVEWIHVGLSHPDIARALYLYGSLEPNWKNLYMVLEVIEDDFGGENELLGQNLVPREDIKLFKRTASSYKAIGREARHASLAFEPPKKPMDLNKAKNLIRSLLQRWIRTKDQSA